ncbi:MAG: alanine/glycine:cation symporter family protein [Bacilli bacterium]|nr:alanine/glycine:cation symporter family protein [Bacilli bacterium]
MIMFFTKLAWGIATIMIIGTGLYFTLQFRFMQFNIKALFSSLKNSFKVNNSSISPFESLTMSLAARIGVGSLAGVALAIYIGGVGTAFWMWISALIAASNALGETILGVVYRKKDEKDIYKGGPPYYIKYGLGKDALAKVVALLIAFSYIFGFLTIQANTITKSIVSISKIYPPLIGLIISFVTALIIFQGVKGIANISSKLVPIMGIIYIAASLVIIILNINQFPYILTTIIKSAFTPKAVNGGIFGSIVIGMQRGIFSNEAGLGTSAIASATTTENKPVEIGLNQVLGVYFTTLVICSMTAFVIMTTNYNALVLNDINGIEITMYAFKYHYGFYGELLVIVTIILFAFSTIIAGYYYGESCLKFLINNIRAYQLFILRLITTILLIAGSIVSSIYLWNFVDLLVALIAIVNLYSLVLLKKDIKFEIEEYKRKNNMIK